MKLKIPKTLKILLVLFIALYIILIFEIGYLNRGETVEKTSSNLTQLDVCTLEVPNEISITFFGDMMFDRYVWHSFKDVGLDKVFSEFDLTKFDDSEIVFANLEGPISADPISDIWVDDNLIFDMPTETINALRYLGINGVSLANNHTLNAGSDGFAITKRLLEESEIKYGGYQNQFDESSIIRFESKIPISIIAVSFVGYNYQEKVLEAIQDEIIRNRFVIIFPHWGVEYSQAHNYVQESLAHAWIDSGADLIIGSHPHVVQDVEIYKDTAIFYSLGNFVFDQMFSKETQQGLGIRAVISENYQKIDILPFVSTKMRPKFDGQVDLDYYVDEKYIKNDKIELRKNWVK